MNFVLDDVLDGGVNDALNLDSHGKALSFLLVDLPLQVPNELSPMLCGLTACPPNFLETTMTRFAPNFTPNRRSVAARLAMLAFVGSSAFGPLVHAQAPAYPSRPLTFAVPFAASSSLICWPARWANQSPGKANKPWWWTTRRAPVACWPRPTKPGPTCHHGPHHHRPA